MASPTTSSAFLDVLRQSGLADEDRLAGYLDGVPGAADLPAADLAARMVRDGLLTQFQANHLLKGRHKNFFVGKFKVLEPLGSGGMSQVFLCEHTVMKHRVAMKLLPIRGKEDPAAVSRFLREARAAAAVNHPNVVRAHDFDLAEGKFYYLIMDYVDGVNLHDLVKRAGPLPAEQAANYTAQAAAGLQHVHECGLVHRDVKPSNLLLARDGVVRLLDLGLARFANDEKDKLTRQFQANSILGTADFLSPEQALQSDNVDVRADIYSLGATLYFLLSGRAPFEEESVTQTLLAHQFRDPEPIPGVPDGLAEVVRTMMAKQADQRYQEPAEVVDALAPFLTELPLPDEAWFTKRAGGGGFGPRTGSPSTPNLAATPTPARLNSPTGQPANGPRSRVNLGDQPSGRLTVSPSSRIRRPGQTSGRLTAGPAEAPKSGKKGVLIGVAAGLLAVVAGVLVAFNPFGSKPDPNPPPGSGSNVAQPKPDAQPADMPPPPAGALVVGPTGRFRTVAEALEQAKPGGLVVVTGREHDEVLRYAGGAANVTVQGWPDTQPVLWRAPATAQASQPVVHLANAAGFVLRNFTLDARQQTDTVLELSGGCPDLLVENVAVRGFRQAGVRVAGGGDPGRPARLHQVRVAGSLESSVGLVFPGAVRNLTVDECRFEGDGAGRLAAGVRVAGPAEAVEVRMSRFFSLNAGVEFTRSAGSVSAGVAVRNNTFCDVGRGLHFEAAPAGDGTLLVQNNLFVRVPKLAQTDGVSGSPAFPTPPWVWHDEQLDPKKETMIPPGTRYFRKTFDLSAVPPAGATLDVGCVSGFKVWVNGAAVGESRPKHFTKRVYAFPVGPLLKPGKNVIAVEAVHEADPVASGIYSAAGLLVRLTPATAPDAEPIAATDDTWRSAKDAAGGWTAAGFADAGWAAVKVWPASPAWLPPWSNAVWDTVVSAQLAGKRPVAVTAGGNVRDYNSHEGYPVLDSQRGFVKDLAGLDPADDSTFLRNPRNLPKLTTLGADGGPVGVPLK